MKTKYELISEKCGRFLHGGDYNPDQWAKSPEIWEEDIRMMKLANCNTMTVGVFSWSALEPEEGVFEFEWLDTIMEKFKENSLYSIIATPSGARPAWLSQKYPEVLRVGANRVRNLHGLRHNHCYSSKVYREKTQIINRKLAERYKDHPSLLMWHISNEFGGECHCDLCQYAFRQWLKEKYSDDLDKLNYSWWTGFWSHKFNDWSQIESPAPHGESMVHGQNLDWKRFVTYQTIDFYKNEIVPLREITPGIPVTTNFMGTYEGLDYWKFAREVDVISWDNYPTWHSDSVKTHELASQTSFVHDINRCLKGGKPFMLMESTPSHVNWHPVNKLKRPGMHLLSSMQAVAHGSDTVQYFQWRKSRGNSEKFHGAVIDHCGHENTRVFREVAEVGEVLDKLEPVLGTTVRPETAIVFDWENRWAIDDCQALRQDKKEYLKTCTDHYKVFWDKGIPVDVLNMDCDFSSYKLLIAPMLYMVRPGVAEKIESFVERGGVLVATYWSGMVDENDLCFLGGFPGPLRKVTGVWSEEIDTLYDEDSNGIKFLANNSLGLQGEYKANTFCDLIHAETAEVIATYMSDFYAGRPSLTVNQYGNGKAYYVASRNEQRFLTDFYSSIVQELGIAQVLDTDLPCGVTAQMRTDGKKRFVFIMNFSEDEKKVSLGNKTFQNMLTQEKIDKTVELKPYGVAVFEEI